jgi:hypothetical protein
MVSTPALYLFGPGFLFFFWKPAILIEDFYGISLFQDKIPVYLPNPSQFTQLPSHANLYKELKEYH